MAQNERVLLATVTGELFQPVRLHYQVFDRAGLHQVFRQLRCIERDPTQSRWVWLYEHEAQTLEFQRSWANLPTQLHPVVIGSFFERSADHFLLDVRSCERALLAVPFFDHYIPRQVARLTEGEVVNQLFDATGNAALTPDQLFDQRAGTVLGSAPGGDDPRGPGHAMPGPAKHGQRSGGKPSRPAIERFPIHYYEDGIDSLTLVLRTRQIVALERWNGNTRYSLTDAIRRIIHGQ